MPAVEVYKHGSKMIPVDGTKVAKAYQCPWTNQLFETKNKYIAHLARLRKNRMHKNAQIRQRAELFNEFINQPSFDELIKWIETHPWFFFDNLIENSRWRTKKFHNEHREKFKIKIRALRLNWDDSLSNSHSCPRGGVENWHRSKTEPKGYPGWSGRIEFSLVRLDGNYFGSDVFGDTGIHTGTGGGDGVNYGYDVKIFASDFPQLEKMAMEKRSEHLQEQIASVLSDSYRTPPFDLPFDYRAAKK